MPSQFTRASRRSTASPFFETINDVEQIAGGQAEYVSWASLASGDYLFYRGVQDGDQFEEKVI